METDTPPVPHAHENAHLDQQVPAPIRQLAHWLTVIGCATLALMMIHICADVMLKYVLSKPLSGTLEIVSGYYMIITIFAPLAMVELRREAIVVDAFFGYFNKRVQYVCIILSFLVALAVFSAFAYQTTLDAMHAFKIGERAMGTAEIPIWPARIIMPVSFALAAIVTLFQLIAHLQGRNPEMADHPGDNLTPGAL